MKKAFLIFTVAIGVFLFMMAGHFYNTCSESSQGLILSVLVIIISTIFLASFLWLILEKLVFSKLKKEIAERKAVEKVLSESEEKYRALYTSSHDSYMIVSPKKGFISCNAATIEMFACKNEEHFISFSPVDLSPDYQPDGQLSSTKAKKMMENAIKNGGNYFEWTHKRVDESEFQATVMLNKLNLGGDLLLQATVRDISVRVQAEKERNRLIHIVESTSDLVGIYYLDKKISYINKAGLEMLGWDIDEEFTQKTLADIHPKSTIDKIIDKGILYAIKHGVWEGETTFIGADNKEHSASQVIIAHFSYGKPEYISTILRDITNSKATQNELIKSRENLRITLDSIGDAVVVTDKNTAILRMNPVAEKLTGYKFEEVQGEIFSNVFTILDSNNNKKYPTLPDAVLADNKVVKWESHTILMSKNEGKKHIASSGAPIKDDENNIIGVILVFRDVTEKRNLESQLRQSQKMDSVGKLAGGIAHDFNNMLGGIIGGAELLSTEISKDSKLQKYLRLIVDATQRASELTEKLLVFSRKSDASFVCVDIHKIINEACDILKCSIDKRILLKTHLLAKKTNISADYVQIQNAIINIGVNARDAMLNTGILTINTSNKVLDKNDCKRMSFSISPGEYIEINISDTGHGMDKSLIEKIFEPFFTTKEPGKGTGLGLSSVYGIIKDHNGIIFCHSTLNVGSKFQIYLPLCNDKILEKVNDEKKMKNGKECILVIDDENVILTTTQDFFSEYGYDIITSNSPKQALEIFKTKRNEIDLIILDMIMPEMNGKELFYKMREITPDFKVIFSSGFTFDNKMSTLLEEKQVKGFLRKPYKFSEIASLVKKALK